MLGMVMDVRAGVSRKAPSPMVSKPSARVTRARSLQPPKAFSPTVLTLPGMAMRLRPLAPKAHFPMLSTPSGSVTLPSALHS